MATIITSDGSKCKIIVDNADTTFYPSKVNVTMSFSAASSTVALTFTTDAGKYSFPFIPIANLNIQGVTIASQSIFDAQILVLFAEGGGSGGITGSVSINDGVSASTKATVAAVIISDAQPSPSNSFALSTGGVAQLFNGNTIDRQRNNIDTGAIVSLAAASVSGVSPDQINYNGRSLQLIVDITAVGGTVPTFTVIIQGKDSASGKYYNLLTSQSFTTVSTNQLFISSGGLAAANQSSSQPLPRVWRVVYNVSGTTPAITATIGASVIV